LVPVAHRSGERPFRKEGDEMTTITGYRLDEVRQGKTQAGTIVERRQTDRGNNISGLLKLAANRFKQSPGRRIQVDFGGISVEL
jgi:hypothetical protein